MSGGTDTNAAVNTDRDKNDELCMSILSPSIIRKLSVVEINQPVSKSGDMTHTPYDGKLGILENKKLCETCNKRNVDCSGHFGHLELEVPIFNPMFSKAIQYLLECICLRCCALRGSKDAILLSGILDDIPISNRLKEVREIFKKEEMCLECGYEFKNLEDAKPEPGFKIGKTVRITAKDAHEYLSRIKDEDLPLFGISYSYGKSTGDIRGEDEGNFVVVNRPENMIFTVLPIIPPCSRPYIVLEDGERKDDDITDIYNNIIKVNNILRAKNNRIPHKTGTRMSKMMKEDDTSLIAKLTSHIQSLIDNSDTTKSNSKKKVHKSIVERLEHKEGRFQSNVIGGRTDQSGRGVIGPGGTIINGNQVGLPRRAAETFTKSVVCRDWNIDHLQRLLEDRKVLCIKRDGKLRKTVFATKNYTRPFYLKFGDIVERQLEDRDWVVYNRQPSLRGESMTAFQVHIIDDNISRLPLMATKQFNADFDGENDLLSTGSFKRVLLPS